MIVDSWEAEWDALDAVTQTIAQSSVASGNRGNFMFISGLG
ncbi:MAG: hypothetical protein R3F08_05605 [Dokdonella sp.]